MWLPPFLRWLVCECVALGLLIWSTKRGLLASTATCRSPSSNLSAATPRPPGLTKMYRPPWNLKPSLLVWSTKNGLLASTATCRSLLSSSLCGYIPTGPTRDVQCGAVLSPPAGRRSPPSESQAMSDALARLPDPAPCLLPAVLLVPASFTLESQAARLDV